MNTIHYDTIVLTVYWYNNTIVVSVHRQNNISFIKVKFMRTLVVRSAIAYYYRYNYITYVSYLQNYATKYMLFGRIVQKFVDFETLKLNAHGKMILFNQD